MSWISDYLTLMMPNKNPRLTRWVLQSAAQRGDAIQFGKTTIALSSPLVNEILRRPTDFELAPVAANKMLLGPFLLGMDPWPTYDETLRDLKPLVDRRRSRFNKLVARLAGSSATRLGEELAAGKPIDLVAEYSSPLLSCTTRHFMGFPAMESSKILKTDDLFSAMSRTIGSMIASSSPAPFGLQKTAEQASVEFSEYLDLHIRDRIETLTANPANRDPNPSPRVSVLDEVIHTTDSLWQGQPSDEMIRSIRANLGGLVLAGSTPLIKAFSNAVVSLLRNTHWTVGNQSAWNHAIAVANLAPSQDQKSQMRALFYESLRFKPVFPVLLRYTPRHVALKKGDGSSLTIPAGSTVVCATLSAMFDNTVTQDAEQFRCPRDNYLHFGGEAHHCLGSDFASDQIVELMIALLKMPGANQLRIRKLQFDGPAVNRLAVQLR